VPPIYAVYARPTHFASRSGLAPLVEQVGAVPLGYDVVWKRVEERSWTLGHILRRAGHWYYRSQWNDLVPLWHELQFSRRIDASESSVVHFLFAEFAGARCSWLFRRQGARLVGSFHASARRQPTLFSGKGCFQAYDHLTVVSRSQVPFFVERGIAPNRISVVLHGVDTDYFTPPEPDAAVRDGPLRGALVGATERDHGFAVNLMRRLPPAVLELKVCTTLDAHHWYRDVPGVEITPHLDDERLLQLYQTSDLLLMPVLDCTANNAILEAMACGTPVCANAVGGIAEYVDAEANFVMPDKDVDRWVDLLVRLHGDRKSLSARRPRVRQWAERFDWAKVALRYVDVYRRTVAS